MAWQPMPQYQQKDTAAKRVASRVAMLLLGIGLLWASWHCIRAGRAVTAELVETRSGRITPRRARGIATGTGIFWLGAAATGLPGLALTGMALVPVSLMERFAGE